MMLYMFEHCSLCFCVRMSAREYFHTMMDRIGFAPLPAV